MTAPVGPTGLAQRCTGAHAEGETSPSSKRVGIGASAYRSTLVMAERVAVEQLAITGTFEVHLDAKRTLSFGAGTVVGGTLFLPARQYHLGPGATVSFGYSQLLVEPKGAVPFVMLAGSIAVTVAVTAAGAYGAGDIRGSIAAGWVLWDRFTPYATARLFGGPVFWNGMIGTDLYHFQLGVGFVLGLPDGLDLVVECVSLGEQSLSAGLGFSF